MVDPTGVIGLIGLFNTCLEAYKICLTINDADEDAKLLRTRLFLEKERFLNVGRTCGLLPHHGKDKKTEALKQFLEEDEFRRKAINTTLELIADLLCKAEILDRKYGTKEGLPESLKDKTVKDSWDDRLRALKASVKKITWSVRDRAAYEDILRHLVGFNTTLESILPGPLQEFLKTVLPATVCASSSESNLPKLEEVSAQHAFLKSQVQWTTSVHTLGLISKGTELEQKDLAKCDQSEKDKSRYLVKRAKEESNGYFLVDWNPWEKTSRERIDRIGSVSGLLGGETCRELRLLSCVGYLEDQDMKMEKTRYALVYHLASRPRKVQSLFQLLETFKTVQLPPLETRMIIARNLCRAMLLYHSSGWIHHDFRSHNIIFVGGSAVTSGAVRANDGEYQRLRLDEPYIIGFGHARDEVDVSLMFADKRAVSKTLKQQRRYWSPDYLSSSGQMLTKQSFQRSHDIYSLGCVLLEIGVWRPLESYTWESAYDQDHNKWHKRLLKEEGKLRAMCGSRYSGTVMQCLNWGSSDIETDIQSLAFDVLLKLEEIVV
ncbi:hypothetical protein AOQ84DRAFT_225374 [Glonium stellatum]|uniref:Protein kinase domain-containing protein n=1 Tax=Glonium stellatum TaxID=574774 RepID=A0A8E2FAR8_9PEZI|nr:hypothetical protein AOQ84DRAFT_225374 [Glonium stellatum]